MKTAMAAWVLAALAWLAPAAAGEAAIKDGMRVAVAGDSLAEHRQYSKMLEMYLRVCLEEKPAFVCQFGWGGEKAPAFAKRLENDCLFFKPTALTACYGFFDGNFKPFDEKAGGDYQAALRDVLVKAKAAGTTVLLAGPFPVDPQFNRNNINGSDYNKTLAAFNAIAKKEAAANGGVFVDIFELGQGAMDKAKEDVGEKFALFPTYESMGQGGHLVMAYAFLKAMGVKGDIGTITIEGNRVAATPGHVAAMKSNGSVEIVSTRWPFCFTGKLKENTTLGVTPYLPFNAELNRFLLVVKDVKEDKAEVAWGGQKRTFTREELAAGVNLADAFAGATPFQSAWSKLDKAVADKQLFEGWWIRNVRSPMNNPALRGAVERVWPATLPEYERVEFEVDRNTAPVTHTLKVTPIKAK